MEADLLVTCPYNPAHRIRKFKFMDHVSKCKKTSNNTENKIECPVDKTHIVDCNKLKEHIKTCSSIGKLVELEFEPKMDKPPLFIDLHRSTENWEEEPEVPPYNPMEVSAKKPVLRCVSGLSKSERKKFRDDERARIANLRGYHTASAISSSFRDMVNEIPLRPPRADTKSLYNSQALENDADNNKETYNCDKDMQANFDSEDDTAKQVEESIRSTDTEVNYVQHLNKKKENFSLSDQNLDQNQETKVKYEKNEKDKYCPSTSNTPTERSIDRLLALLKNEKSIKKIEPVKETTKETIDQTTNNNTAEKDSSWNETFRKLNERLARRYDTRTTIFSPEGRLYQVEYAMEAISHAGTCLGILANDGILLAAEKRNTNKLLDDVFFSEKIYRLNEDIVCSVAGITSDANVLTNELRLIAQRYYLQYNEPIPCEQLVSWLCDVKQAYTQYGGKRPFGVSILYMGWDKHYGYQLYQSDPSGNYGGWKATCIGNNSAAAVSSLKQEYKEGETTLKDAMALAIKVLSKTLDMNKLSAEKVEMAILTRENGKTKTKILPAKEVDALIAEHDRLEALAEQAKKEKQKS
ncbi:hypothetical protein P5V15_008500 [Pogonomyrmex californicus]